MTQHSPSPTADEQTIIKTIQIHAPVSVVWQALTEPALMQKWMFETELNIITDWQVGGPILIRGKLHGMKFENTGKVLQFDAPKRLTYSQLSSTSRLADVPESYSMMAFALTPSDDQTTLTVTVSNFPTEVIYKHMAFYWNVTPGILKKMIEEQMNMA